MADSAPTSAKPLTAPSGISRFRRFLEANYSLDFHSLSLFRILLGILLLGDLFLLRLPDLRAHYTDFGVLPRHALLEQFSDQWLVSLHLVSGRWEIQLLLFIVAAFFAFRLLIGYNTRFSAVMCWLLLMSLQNRNEGILQGGDVLLRALTFWAMFVPLNAYWSVDAAMDDSGQQRPQRNSVFNGGTIGLFTQAILLYVIAALLKTGDVWRVSGLAVWYALSLNQMATPLGHWLLNFPLLLKFLTFFTLVVEFLAPLFLLIPGISGPVRTATLLILTGLQLGFRFCLNVGHFPFVASTLMIPLLPTWFWNQARANSWWASRLERMRRLTLIYDGGCDFCRKMVLLIREFFLSRETRVVAAQSDPALHEEMRRENSWIVINAKGERFYRTAAMAEVFRHSILLAPFGWLLRRPAVCEICDDFYRGVERRRPLLSRWISFLRPRPLDMQVSKWASAFALIATLYIVYWNLFMVNRERFPISPKAAIPGVLMRLDQNWGMFAPGPLDHDGWYVIPGRLRNNSTVDLMRDGAPVETRVRSPREMYTQYPNERWRKYMMNLQTETSIPHRVHFGKYLCRKWNEGRTLNDPQLLLDFDIYFYSRDTVPPGQTPGPYLPIQLHKHSCFK